jgi:hypothetical protein
MVLIISSSYFNLLFAVAGRCPPSLAWRADGGRLGSGSFFNYVDAALLDKKNE